MACYMGRNKPDRLSIELEVGAVEMNDKFMKILVTSGVIVLVFGKAKAAGKVKSSVPYSALIDRLALELGVNGCLVAAVIKKESDFIPDAVNPSDPSYGLGQITLPTAQQFRAETTKAELFDPEVNIKIMCQFISWLEKNGAGMPGAISAYNTGLQGWRIGNVPNPPNYSEIIKGYMEDLCA